MNGEDGQQHADDQGTRVAHEHFRRFPIEDEKRQDRAEHGEGEDGESGIADQEEPCAEAE